MKSLGVIPARGGSKGIPRKNIKLLNNRPLISYSIQSALNSDLDKVVVSTDDEEIAEYSSSEGVEVIIRPDSLSKDDSPTLPVLQHVKEVIGDVFDSMVTLQPTSPFRKIYTYK